MSAPTRPLPTGQELMSGPITSGAMTRQEKEIWFVMDNIENRLKSLKNDEGFQTYKWTLFAVSVFSAMVGVTLILFGLHLTFFFERFEEENLVAIVFGGIFCSPVLFWFYYVFLPSKAERRRRKRIHIDRMDRRKPTLFNQLVEEARKFTEPPPRKIRVFAHIRKHDYPIVASTMHDFMEAVANQSGIAIERQLLRHNDTDLEIHLHEKLDEYYKLDDNAKIFVYNKGGYFTADSPLKKARTGHDIMRMNESMENGEAQGTPGRVSFSATGAGNRPSFSQQNQGGRNSTNSSATGLKSAMSAPAEGRDSFSTKKPNISWKS